MVFPISSIYKNLSKIFSKELLFISILAGCFIILSITEILFSFEFNKREQAFLYFIATIIFLNSIHLGLTFFLLFENKAFQNWRKHSPKSLLSFDHKLIFLFICFWGFWFFHEDMAYNIGSLLFYFYFFYHIIKQHLGISLSLNHKYSQLHKIPLKLMKNFEHIFFNLMIGISWIFISLKHFFYLKQQEHIYTSLIIYIQLGYLLIISVYLFLNYMFFGREFFKKKIYFFPRLLIYPFLPTSFLAMIGLLSIHGMEYFFVTKNFISPKKNFILPKKKSTSFKKILFSFGFFLFLIISFLSLVDTKYGLFAVLDITPPHPFHTIFWATFGACELLHYWADGQIFKMKDPLVRKYIAPALNK